MSTTPAGWYPDPADGTNQRFWDGVAWTHATRPAPPPGAPPTAAAGQAVAGPAAAGPAAAGPAAAGPAAAGKVAAGTAAADTGSGSRRLLLIGLPLAVVLLGGAAAAIVLLWPGSASATLGYEWERVPHDPATFSAPHVGDAAMWDVATNGDTWVAVGSIDDADGSQVGAIWTSEDGRDWERVPHDERLFGGEGMQSIETVIVGGPGFVAGGFDGVWGNEVNAAVWISEDGRRWERVPHDPAVFGGDTSAGMWDVTLGGPGLVAVGTNELSNRDVEALVWHSEDGISWERVTPDPDAFGQSDHEVLWAVTASGDGLVATGFDGGWGTDARPVAWTSPDGRSWRRHTLQGEGGEPIRVIDTSDGPLAIGRNNLDPDEPANLWTSEDGNTWQAHHVPGRMGNQPAAVVAAVEVSSRVIAVGAEGDWDVGLRPVVWVRDGEEWTPQRLPDTDGGEGHLWGVAREGSTAVAVGYLETSDGQIAAIWTSE